MASIIQADFLNKIKTDEISITIFLINGIKLIGLITFFDDNIILLKRDGHTQLVYKHAVSTIMPSNIVEL